MKRTVEDTIEIDLLVWRTDELQRRQDAILGEEEHPFLLPAGKRRAWHALQEVAAWRREQRLVDVTTGVTP